MAEIQGVLQSEPGKPPVLKSQGKDIPLASNKEDIGFILADARLSGKAMKLVGRFHKDRTFNVDELFIVRKDGLYRLIYFCFTCNITTFQPANCECCQEPTVPLEVPLTDPRVYHQEIPGPPRSQ